MLPPIGWFFLLMVAAATISCFAVLFAILRMTGEINELTIAVAELVQMKPPQETAFLRPLWPYMTVACGIGVNGVTTAGLAAIWLWVLGYRPFNRIVKSPAPTETPTAA